MLVSTSADTSTPATPNFVIDGALSAAVPDFVRHVVVVALDGPLDASLAASAVRNAASAARTAAQNRTAAPFDEPVLVAWRDAFAAVGIDPAVHRPAHEALLRRALDGRDVVLGDPLVDAGNAVSLTHRVPVGVHDLNGFDEVMLRRAVPGDEFTALDGSRSDPEPGEMVFVAGSTVLTRRWVWRQGVAGSLSPDSAEAFVNVDLVDGRDDGAVAMLRDLVEAIGGRVTGEIVVPACPVDPLLHELRDRGVVHDCTSLGRWSAAMRAPISLYCGIDPTAPSLHVGSLLVFATLRRFRAAGHRPIVVVGGATGFIGDPSGRGSERNLLDHATLDANMAGMRPQIERLLAVGGAGPEPIIVDNREWIAGMDALQFCRDVGVHFRVGEMLGRESVRARLESPQGLSFTEFSYSLLQALDFKVLRERHDCRLQVGGSDQWGNIVAGVDLIRRTLGVDGHGLTWPLLTKADGEKFGKSGGDNVWLDPARTSVWAFWQFWLNQTDEDSARLLRLLT